MRASVSQSSIAWQHHVVNGKLQPRKCPDSWLGAAAASPANQLLLLWRQWVPEHTSEPSPRRFPARHWEGLQYSCLAQGYSAPALELQLGTPDLQSWSLYTGSTGHTKTRLGILKCLCKSHKKTCICKVSQQ